MTAILGISAYYHDSAACVVVDGVIIAAAQQERFSRRKHDPRFPIDAVKYCLSEAGLTIAEIDSVVFYDKPLLKFERLLETYLAHAPKGFLSFVRAMPVWLKEKLYLKSVLRRELKVLLPEKSASQIPPLLFTEHHQSHAASAFYPSPFEEAAVVCMDGVGEWATSSLWHGKGNTLTIRQELHFPHSLGLLYSAFTYYCGFRVNAGEYKLMGLAPYGTPRFVETIYQHLIDVKPDGSYRLNMRYFDFAVGSVMTNNAFAKLFGAPALTADATPNAFYCDMASSIQQVTEEIVIKVAQHAHQLTGSRHLCLAGGVALNCVANAKIVAHTGFDKIWVQPASGDAGGALGAALCAWYSANDKPRNTHYLTDNDAMQGAQLGPAYSDEDIAQAIHEQQLPAVHLTEQAVRERVVLALTQECVVGWFQGRMEFGPRALGNRSILGDARSDSMQRKMNVAIKQRESFRPFAPIVLAEDCLDYFDFEGVSPYMLMTAPVKSELRCAVPPQQSQKNHLERVNQRRSYLPAITHIDFSARLQTVEQHINPRLHALLSAFKQKTGTAVLINTSFNVRGEPPVCTPKDAIRGFLATDMDILVMGNWLLEKSSQCTEAIQRARRVTFDKD
ncbi:carbamoyltransferase family protein [Alteromonas oceanisediminis]|uniref:carbamoyltransferase family protein n=1 Tax=Alteromonas oceanisediminis TaxID=2836180 RepID=UPI001BDAE616|nr:carbamoyltransferase [Alteromonas oceanisediminis]MBT0586459.1 carbamoyltransferase [Alteromonas oceanisediminis]